MCARVYKKGDGAGNSTHVLQDSHRARACNSCCSGDGNTLRDAFCTRDAFSQEQVLRNSNRARACQSFCIGSWAQL